MSLRIIACERFDDDVMRMKMKRCTRDAHSDDLFIINCCSAYQSHVQIVRDALTTRCDHDCEGERGVLVFESSVCGPVHVIYVFDIDECNKSTRALRFLSL